MWARHVTPDSHSDKDTERTRYDERAQRLLDGPPSAFRGADSVGALHRAPYRFYESCIRDMVRPDHRVLELGAGTGRHTVALLETGAAVTATDISPAALKVLDRDLGQRSPGRLRTRVADIESLPFDDQFFDVVACAGSLSYGEPAVVDSEVLRILRRGGMLIFVDSLNHNPIYRLNRWAARHRGARTRSTIAWMPTLQRIRSLAMHFESTDIRYFGSLAWLMSAASRIVGTRRAAMFSDAWDRRFAGHLSAFKFVLVAKGKR